ncbi:SH3 domain-containing protein [Ectobacillus funiculus]
MRSGPSMQHSIIRVMHKNETYKVYGETNGWYNLGGNQWCSANPAYVSFTPSLQAIGEIKLLVDLNVRSGPSMQHSIIRVMHKNEIYKVYGETNGWYNLGGNQWCFANPAYAAFKSY